MSELTEEHADKEIQAEINKILTSSSRIGLLINERFINIPPKIADPLLTSLDGELERIRKKDAAYDFQYLIMVCKIYKPKANKGNYIL